MTPQAEQAAVASATVIAQIQAARARLSKSEQRVADALLARGDAAAGMSIGALAAAASVSQPTVVRFCLSLGYRGFKEFKLALARSLSGGVPYVHRDVTGADTLGEVALKVIQRTCADLARLQSGLDAAALQQAVDLLVAARRIEFYGLGNSGIVAEDAQHKFFRLGAPCVAYADPHIQGMAATLLKPGDVVVAISSTGRTRDLLRSVELARQSGAAVIAITVPDSALARLATVALASDAEEDSDVYAPMTARILHLTVIDILAVAVALARGPDLLADLEKSKQSLRERRV